MNSNTSHAAAVNGRLCPKTEIGAGMVDSICIASYCGCNSSPTSCKLYIFFSPPPSSAFILIVFHLSLSSHSSVFTFPFYSTSSCLTFNLLILFYLYSSIFSSRSFQYLLCLLVYLYIYIPIVFIFNIFPTVVIVVYPLP